MQSMQLLQSGLAAPLATRRSVLSACQAAPTICTSKRRLLRPLRIQACVYVRQQAILTERLLKDVPSNPLKGLENADKAWKKLQELDPSSATPPAQVVREDSGHMPSSAADTSSDIADVVICGGTLGVILGAALATKGLKVTIIERGPLIGRDQEWNISRREMAVFSELGLLTEQEIEQAIVTEFNPVRVGFRGLVDITTEGILNCGVDPCYLIETLKNKLLQLGGTILEYTAFAGAVSYSDGVVVDVHSVATGSKPSGAGGAGGASAQFAANDMSSSGGTGKTQLRCRLLLDCLGNFSPVAAQSRGAAKPESVVMVVGTCATGPGLSEDRRDSCGDLLYAFTDLNQATRAQYFWEAFPARDGLTTYMFCYVDPAPERFSLTDMFEDYLRLLPEYQGLHGLEEVTVKRALFGFFPCFREQSPLRAIVPRLLHVGDASGNRSALSFGGFMAMVRHLQRLTEGIDEALQADALSVGDLAMLQPYQPCISVTGMFQLTMGTRVSQNFDKLPPSLIKDFIGTSFKEMAGMGDSVLKPFLSDVMQWGPLSKVVWRTLVAHPRLTFDMNTNMGDPLSAASLARHFFFLAAYTALHKIHGNLKPPSFLPPRMRYRWHRKLEEWEYGSGYDYKG